MKSLATTQVQHSHCEGLPLLQIPANVEAKQSRKPHAWQEIDRLGHLQVSCLAWCKIPQAVCMHMDMLKVCFQDGQGLELTDRQWSTEP